MNNHLMCILYYNIIENSLKMFFMDSRQLNASDTSSNFAGILDTW